MWGTTMTIKSMVSCFIVEKKNQNEKGGGAGTRPRASVFTMITMITKACVTFAIAGKNA